MFGFTLRSQGIGFLAQFFAGKHFLTVSRWFAEIGPGLEHSPKDGPDPGQERADALHLPNPPWLRPAMAVWPARPLIPEFAVITSPTCPLLSKLASSSKAYKRQATA